ncbi:MAG TPA: ribosome recycling factor [Myxococcota bacterium]|jgi:ribosome recycling factor|nr:ribosome recycling factor [Myxococcota bacterium]
MTDDIIANLQTEMGQTLEALKRDLAKVRTGRANLAILEGIRVDYYGVSTPLNQVAALKIADPRLITIKPWEKGMVAPIEKAILGGDIGLTPSNDGELIRLPIPPLTQERREQLAKQVRKIGEEARVAMRGHRRDANEMLKDAQTEGEITEDDMRRGLTRVQQLTDEHVTKADEIVEKKEQEILNG